MRVGSLFAGIGGFDLAARWMGWETAWLSEIEPYACSVLRRQFPGVPNLGDITKITNPPPVDALVGGFPCQDISSAGKGVGIGGSRSGLWKEYARIIGLTRPSWIVAENSPMLRTRGLGVVLRDLAALGYDAEWHCVPARAVGAPHQRDRLWIVGYPDGKRFGGPVLRDGWLEGGRAAAPEGAVHAHVSGRGAGGVRLEDVADAVRPRLEGHAGHGAQLDQRGRLDAQAHRPARAAGVRGGGYPEGWWVSEPDVGRVAHGIPARVDRTRCLGNAVVPHIPYLIFNAIANAMR